MNKKLLLALFAMSLTALAVQPSMAKTTKVSCTQVKRALRSGKTQEQVAKSLKVSPEVVRGCTQRNTK